MRQGRPPSTIKSFAAPAGTRPASPSLLPAAIRSAPPPTSSPTREYRQHHTVEPPRIDSTEFRPAWRAKTRLVALAETDKIDRRQLEAALEWRAWHEALGRVRVQAWEIRIGSTRLPGTPTPFQITAAGELRAALAAIGAERVRLLEWSIVDDMPWASLAKKLGLSDKTAISRVVEAIAALTLWRQGRPVPDPPPARFRNQPRSW